MQRAFLIFYTLLYILITIFLLPKEYFKRPKELRNRWIKEKMGFFKKTQALNSNKRPKIWVHAVSVGEVIAVSGLIKRLTEKYDVILSTVTDTGQRIAHQRFKEMSVRVIYLPFDIPNQIKKTLKFFSPQALLLTETELWPNLIYLSSEQLPLILINGRLSEESFKGYVKIKFFIKPLLKRFSLICVQDEKYRERFIKIGAEENKVYVTGNMKFDIELREVNFKWEKSIPKPVILAGSTHEQEEEIILNAFLNLGLNGTLIIAPRHPERFPEVCSLVKKKISESRAEIYFKKLTEINNDPIIEHKTLILLIDQMGILGSLYRVCDIAVIGGSFIPHGGQNPLEPAYWRKPIICGPYMQNFPFIQEFIEQKACIMTDKDSFKSRLESLIKNPEQTSFMGIKANEIFSKNRGATEKTLKLLKNFIQF